MEGTIITGSQRHGPCAPTGLTGKEDIKKVVISIPRSTKEILDALGGSDRKSRRVCKEEMF